MSIRNEDDAKLIHVGATIPQLAQIFGMAQKTVQSRVIGRVMPARPKGQTEKDPLRYHLRDVAPLLCDPKVDIEAILRSMTPAKMPPLLQDAFWKGQKSRLEVEEKMGNLWSTEKVVQMFGEAFKPCRMSILMFKEEVEQQEELSASARALLDQMSDSLLESLHAGLVEQFRDYVPSDDEHGQPLTETAVVSARELAQPEDDDGFDDGF